jgi:hypothetical protein
MDNIQRFVARLARRPAESIVQSASIADNADNMVRREASAECS